MNKLYIIYFVWLFSCSCYGPKGSCRNSYAERWVSDYFTTESVHLAQQRNIYGFMDIYCYAYRIEENKLFTLINYVARENQIQYLQIADTQKILVFGLKAKQYFTAQKTPAQYADYTEKHKDKGKFKYCPSTGPISRAYGLERTEGISVVDKNTGEDLTASTQIYYKFMDIPKREQLLVHENLSEFNARQLNAIPVFILELAESRKGKRIEVCMRLENRQDPLCVVYE